MDQDDPSPNGRRVFRWEIVWTLLAVAGFAWFMHRAATPPFSWEAVMRSIGIRNETRFTRLATLAVLATAVVAVARVLKGNGRE